MEGVEHDLLDRADVGDQPGKADRHRQRVTARLRLAQGLADRSKSLTPVERAPELRMERLGQADPRPGEHDGGVKRDHDENRSPRREQKDQLPDVRRQHRHQHEGHEDEAHHPRHGLRFEQVAHHRHDQHPRHRRRRAHRHTPGDEQRKAPSEGAQESEAGVEDHSSGQDGLAPKPVGERSPQELRRSETEEIGNHDQLLVVLMRNVQRSADVRQRRYHRIDGERIERHQPREHHRHLARAGALHAVMSKGVEHGTRLLADWAKPCNSGGAGGAVE